MNVFCAYFVHLISTTKCDFGFGSNLRQYCLSYFSRFFSWKWFILISPHGFLLSFPLSAYHFAWQCEFIGFYGWIQEKKKKTKQKCIGAKPIHRKVTKTCCGTRSRHKIHHVDCTMNWANETKNQVELSLIVWHTVFVCWTMVFGIIKCCCACVQCVCCLQALSFLFSLIRLRFRCCHTDDSMHIVYLTFLHQQRYRHQFVFATLHRIEHNLWESLMEVYSKHIRLPTGYTFIPFCLQDSVLYHHSFDAFIRCSTQSIRNHVHTFFTLMLFHNFRLVSHP